MNDAETAVPVQSSGALIPMPFKQGVKTIRILLPSAAPFWNMDPGQGCFVYEGRAGQSSVPALCQ